MHPIPSIVFNYPQFHILTVDIQKRAKGIIVTSQYNLKRPRSK